MATNLGIDFKAFDAICLICDIKTQDKVGVTGTNGYYFVSREYFIAVRKCIHPINDKFTCCGQKLPAIIG